ncbi:MAG TPA: hypothetical protein VN889_07330 [Solirubrobacteraceae bacterium]|nr:hypothetical protein [Solirubrobacteraceae bacterium]
MAYMTWNQLGAQVAAAILMNRFQGRLFNPHYICLQEAGNPGWGGAIMKPLPLPAWAPPASELFALQGLFLRGKLYDGFYLYWVGKPGGNPRCSLAVLHLATLGPHVPGGWWDGNKKHRPVLWTRPAGGWHAIGCVHAPSGGNPVYVRVAVEAMFASFPGALGLTWRLVGDFNLHYPELVFFVQPGWPPPLNALPSNSSGGQTQRYGGDFDYSMGTLPNTAHCVSADSYMFGSDHLAVAFW